MANLIIENKNVTSEPMYNPIFLKAGLAKIYKILDKFTCAVDDKLMMCFNGDSLIDAADLPLKYSMKCSVSYDLNQLADQDGTVEQHCTNAFINKISIVENYTYYECAESHIGFSDLLLNILDEIDVADLPETGTQVRNATRIVRDMLNLETSTGQPNQLITNVINRRNRDEGSGQFTNNRQIVHDLYQSSVVSLQDIAHDCETGEISDGNSAHVLEGFSIELDKAEAFGLLNISVRSVTIRVCVNTDHENPQNIDVSATCMT